MDPKNNSPKQIAKALAERDPSALRDALAQCAPEDAQFANLALSGRDGRKEVANLLRGEMTGQDIRDSILGACAPTEGGSGAENNALREKYNHLAKGFIAGSLAACRDDPRLVVRACEVAQAFIEVLPRERAAEVHASLIVDLSILRELQPKTAGAVTGFMYPALAGEIQRRASMIGDDFFDAAKDPRLTPAGAAAMYGFEPALERLIEQAPPALVAKHLDRLKISCAGMEGSEVFAKNIADCMDQLHAQTQPVAVAARKADPSANRHQGLQAWVQ